MEEPNAKELVDRMRELRPENAPARKEAKEGELPERPRRLLGTELASEPALAEDWLSERDEEAWLHL